MGGWEGSSRRRGGSLPGAVHPFREQTRRASTARARRRKAVGGTGSAAAPLAARRRARRPSQSPRRSGREPRGAISSRPCRGRASSAGVGTADAAVVAAAAAAAAASRGIRVGGGNRRRRRKRRRWRFRRRRWRFPLPRWPIPPRPRRAMLQPVARFIDREVTTGAMFGEVTPLPSRILAAGAVLRPGSTVHPGGGCAVTLLERDREGGGIDLDREGVAKRRVQSFGSPCPIGVTRVRIVRRRRRRRVRARGVASEHATDLGDCPVRTLRRGRLRIGEKLGESAGDRAGSRA